MAVVPNAFMATQPYPQHHDQHIAGAPPTILAPAYGSRQRAPRMIEGTTGHNGYETDTTFAATALGTMYPAVASTVHPHGAPSVSPPLQPYAPPQFQTAASMRPVAQSNSPSIQPMQFNFNVGPHPVDRHQPVSRDLVNQESPINAEMRHLDQIANVKATPAGMKQQIQELVDGQKSIQQEIDSLKHQVNSQFTEVEDLRLAAEQAREMNHQVVTPYQPFAQETPPPVQAPPPVREVENSGRHVPPANLGYTRETVMNHPAMSTMNNHLDNAGGWYTKQRSAGKRFVCF